jgi:predicted enzyme related to lactoylglutathione lyase
MPITGIQSIYTVVLDMDRSQDFYAKTLGLSTAFRDGHSWCQFAVGATPFALASCDEAAPGAHGSVAVFQSQDLDDSRRSIEKAGGRLVSQRDMGSHGSVQTFTDLEGNIFQIFAKVRTA